MRQRKQLDLGGIRIVSIQQQSLPDRSIQGLAGRNITHIQKDEERDEADRSPNEGTRDCPFHA